MAQQNEPRAQRVGMTLAEKRAVAASMRVELPEPTYAELFAAAFSSEKRAALEARGYRFMRPMEER